MTAYATASGYSQSSSATKSCTYTVPPLDPPTITTEYRAGDAYVVATGPVGCTMYLSGTWHRSSGGGTIQEFSVTGTGSAEFRYSRSSWDDGGYLDSASAYYTLDGRTSPTAYF